MSKEELIQSIYDAFKDVKLEDGIGVLETDKIDAYYKRDSAECKQAYQKDEREDWTKLLDILYFGDWPFMDAKGIRFHLPCFLLKDIDKKAPGDNPLISMFNICTSDVIRDKLSMLNDTQTATILDFFNYKIEESIAENNDNYFMEYQNAKNNFEQYIINKQ